MKNENPKLEFCLLLSWSALGRSLCTLVVRTSFAQGARSIKLKQIIAFTRIETFSAIIFYQSETT